MLFLAQEPPGRPPPRAIAPQAGGCAGPVRVACQTPALGARRARGNRVCRARKELWFPTGLQTLRPAPDETSCHGTAPSHVWGSVMLCFGFSVQDILMMLFNKLKR